MSKSSEKRAYWNDIICQYHSSQQTQKYFCEAKNISFGVFKYWLARVKKSEPPKKNRAIAPPSFTKISLAQQSSFSGYSVKLPNGIHCTVPSHFDSSEVMKLLGILLQC